MKAQGIKCQDCRCITPYVIRVLGVRLTIEEEEEKTDEPNNIHEEENDVRKNVLCVVKDL